MASKTLPRGIRNNNPLNLRHSSSKWHGLRKFQTDSDFCQFDYMVMGIRAAMLNMVAHCRRDPYTSIEKEVYRWAPPSENNVRAYLLSIEINSGGVLSRHQAVRDLDEKQFCLLFQCMSIHECGEKLPLDIFYEAFDLAFHGGSFVDML